MAWISIAYACAGRITPSRCRERWPSARPVTPVDGHGVRADSGQDGRATPRRRWLLGPRKAIGRDRETLVSHILRRDRLEVTALQKQRVGCDLPPKEATC